LFPAFPDAGTINSRNYYMTIMCSPYFLDMEQVLYDLDFDNYPSYCIFINEFPLTRAWGLFKFWQFWQMYVKTLSMKIKEYMTIKIQLQMAAKYYIPYIVKKIVMNCVIESFYFRFGTIHSMLGNFNIKIQKLSYKQYIASSNCTDGHAGLSLYLWYKDHHFRAVRYAQ
jgi:hypothetical protein